MVLIYYSWKPLALLFQFITDYVNASLRTCLMQAFSNMNY